MPRYLLLSTLTNAGRESLHSHPERLMEVDQEIQRMGVKVIAQYALLGQYDFVSIVEAPDNETMAHLSVDLGSRGTVQIVTLPAISLESFQAALKGPHQLGRGAPPDQEPGRSRSKG
jgi:uncharacterized protein with GYD domain